VTYTEEDRTKGLAIYQEHGLATAHRETGVPRATLHRWARAAGFDPADIVERCPWPRQTPHLWPRNSPLTATT
jgi:hypothetical protein